MTLSSQLEDLKKLIQQDKYLAGLSDSKSTIKAFQNDATKLTKFVWQVSRACRWIWLTLIKPVLLWLSKPMRWCFWKYVAYWDKIVYTVDNYQVRHFSKIKAGSMVLGTGITILYVVPLLVSIIWEMGWYFSTVRHNEQVILFDSQEIGGPKDDVHSVKGCHNVVVPCPDNDTIYYRVRPATFHHLWSLAHHGDLFYPDFIAAAVPPGYSLCTVTSYGIRQKFILRNWSVYPELLEISCKPYKT